MLIAPYPSLAWSLDTNTASLDFNLLLSTQNNPFNYQISFPLLRIKTGFVCRSLPVLHFDPYDGDDIFLRYVGNFTNYAALWPRR
jgi:hypothetical protein